MTDQKKTQHPFIKKLTEIHHQTTENDIRITEPMKKTLLDMLRDESTNVLLNELENEKLNEDKIQLLENINKKLLECVYTISKFDVYDCKYNSTDFDELIFTINKKCKVHFYNKNINERLNNDIDFLLKHIEADKNVLKKITKETGTEQFYIMLLRCVRHQDFLKVFTMIPEGAKTYAVSKVALEKDYNMIKYVDKQTEELCLIALLMGHKNLFDIKKKNYTVNICKKYVDADINNLRAIELDHQLKFSDLFFMEYIKQNPKHITLIDKHYITPEIRSYVVKHDGTLIKYIDPIYQTPRLIDLACEQNPNSKYYVTYDCPQNADVDWLKSKQKEHLNLVKRLDITKEHQDKFDEIKKKLDEMENEYNENTELLQKNVSENNVVSGITTKVTFKNCGFFVMTPENYINHQHVLRLENGFSTEFKVLLDKTPILNTFFSKNITRSEYVTVITDQNSNQFVVFVEIFE